jgi:hypothetical protein
VCVLSHSQSVDNGGPLGSAVERCGKPQFVGRDAGDAGHPVGVVVVERGAQLGEAGYAFSEKRLIHMPAGQEEMSEPVEDRDVGARTVGQVHLGDGSEFGATWIDHDQPGSLPYQLLQTRADDRVRLRGIGTDEQDAVGPVQVVEGVRAA